MTWAKGSNFWEYQFDVNTYIRATDTGEYVNMIHATIALINDLTIIVFNNI